MNRADVLMRRRILQEKKDYIVGAAMFRLDVKMRDKSVQERQSTLVYGSNYSEEEWRQLGELKEKIEGYDHMLRQGFFQQKVTPEKNEEEEDLLY